MFVEQSSHDRRQEAVAARAAGVASGEAGLGPPLRLVARLSRALCPARRGSWSRPRWWRRAGASSIGSSAVAVMTASSPDRDRLPLGHMHRPQDPGHGGDLGVHLLGGLEQHVVDRDGVADLCQRVIVPSVTVSPSWGIVMSSTALHCTGTDRRVPTTPSG